jgi:hypothetical protein
MRIEIQQAIASVFGIRLATGQPMCGGTKVFERTLPTGVTEILGCICHNTLAEIVRKLVADPCTDLEAKSDILPITITSKRQELYAIIELECLMQETHEGARLIDMLSKLTDSREVVSLIMDTLRGCAVNYLDPEAFAVHLGRTIVVALTAFEWARSK